jgi:hypothetical protein
MSVAIPSLGEFKDAILTHCGFLLRDFGFTALPDPLEHNEYSVRFRKGKFGVDVYGEGYGTHVDCRLLHGSSEESVWIHRPVPARLPRKRRTKGPGPTQLAQIERIAGALREHWTDFLEGDLTSFRQRSAAWLAFQRSLKRTPEQMARRPFDIASTEAGHAFKSGEFARVVLLLRPYSALLGKKQKQMLETSLDRVRNDSG